MKFKGKITGDKTHEIGYRVFLLRKALEIGIERFNAHNTFEKNNQIVIFYIESDLKTAMEYKEFVNVNAPENAIVSELSFNEYSGYVTSIIDYMHLIQVEQLSKGIPAILSIDNKQDQMLGKQDQMLEKQDTTIEILMDVKEDISTIRDEISTSKNDVKDIFYEKYEYLSREIIDIKATLSEIEAKIA